MPVVNTVLKRFPWGRAYLMAGWLFKQGKTRLQQNMTESERGELWDLMKKSGGQRAKLNAKEQKRFTGLVRQGMTGRKA